MQGMVFALLGFDLILIQSFLTVPTLFPFRMRMFILHHIYGSYGSVQLFFLQGFRVEYFRKDFDF